MLTQTLDIYGTTLAFSYFKSTLWFQFWIDEQVLHFFVVDFKHGELHLICNTFIFIFCNPFKDLITSKWNDTFVGSIANHGIALARSSLSVSEQTAMESLPSIIQNLLTKALVDALLIGVLATFLCGHVSFFISIETIM